MTFFVADAIPQRRRQKRRVIVVSSSDDDEIAIVPTASTSTYQSKKSLMQNELVHAKNRIDALEATLQTIQSEQEKLEDSMKMNGRRSPIGGTELHDEPKGDERKRPVFVRYDAKEKERKTRVEKRFEKVGKALEIARAKRDGAEVERLEESMATLREVLKEFEEEKEEEEEEEEADDECVESSETENEEGSGDVALGGTADRGELSEEDKKLLHLYKLYAEPFWRDIAARFELAEGPLISAEEVEERIMALRQGERSEGLVDFG
jgi:hypothetical protein